MFWEKTFSLMLTRIIVYYMFQKAKLIPTEMLSNGAILSTLKKFHQFMAT